MSPEINLPTTILADSTNADYGLGLYWIVWLDLTGEVKGQRFRSQLVDLRKTIQTLHCFPQAAWLSGVVGLDANIQDRFADGRLGEVAFTGHSNSWLLPEHGSMGPDSM